MSSASGAKPRALAAEVISAVRFDGRSLKAALPDALSRLADPRDRALCEAICFTAVRWMPRYEFWLSKLLDKPLPNASKKIHGLLLAGLAQLEAMGLSDYAAIASSAEAARTLGQPRLVGLVNAILRRYVREKDALIAAANNDVQASTAHPRWLIDRYRKAWPEYVDSLISQGNQQAPMWLRVNLRHGSREDYLARLEAQGIQAMASPIAPAAIQLTRQLSPALLPGWEAGDVSVQDLSAQGAALLLEAQSGDRVLDMGAAPGGKTAQLLESCNTLHSITALDIDAARIERLTTALSRLGLTAKTVVGDGTKPESWWDGHHFDRILLDAPCSATGVIRRQPDIKWHRQAKDIAPLVKLQAALLDSAWSMLRTGGRLVYATCSVLPDENDRQIHAFLARHTNARLVQIPVLAGLATAHGVQRFPESDGGDGFFYAVLEKGASDLATDAECLH